MKKELERIAPCGLHCGKCFAFSDGDIHAASNQLRNNLGCSITLQMLHATSSFRET